MRQTSVSLIPALLAALVICAGCSEIEPQTGTRVVFALPAGRHVSREEIRLTGRYLTAQSRLILGASRARIQSVGPSSITLLLPGKKLTQRTVELLTHSPGVIELYHLSHVATKRHPDRPWSVEVPKSGRGSYLLTGPGGKRIDSRREPARVLREVVGTKARPVLSAQDILPNAGEREAKGAWVVLVQFTQAGAKRFHDFTRKNSGEYLAVFLNKDLISAPLVQGPVPGGRVFLTGFASREQAKKAVDWINAGQLPFKITVRSVEHY